VEGGALGSLVTRYLPLVALMDRHDRIQDPVRKCIVEIIVEGGFFHLKLIITSNL